MPNNNVAYCSIHQVRNGDMVPGAGQDVTCAMYSAVVMNPGGGIIAAPDGERSVTDINFVAVAAGDTPATVQANVLAAVRAIYGDQSITAEFL
jgi:hypothetical protein